MTLPNRQGTKNARPAMRAAIPGTEDERACKQVVAILQQGRVNCGSNKDFKL